MSNEIITTNSSVEVYDRITNPMEAIKVLGQSIFKSGLFGCDKMEQGEVLAMQCLSERKSPLELARTYHFIQGQLAIRSDALLAKYLISGGVVEWTERTDTRVVGKFFKAGMSAVIVADIEEYKRNGTAFSSPGKLKANWEKWPRRMLTARAISEGVRLISPDCCFGVAIFEDSEVSENGRRIQRVEPIAKSIIELIPPGKTEKAIELLIQAHMLEAGQSLSDLSAVDEETILKKPKPFLNALNS